VERRYGYVKEERARGEVRQAEHQYRTGTIKKDNGIMPAGGTNYILGDPQGIG